MSVLLDAAQDCLPRGWPLVPLRGKSPALLGAGWLERASTDPAVIADWDQRWSGANAGLVVFDHLLAIDVDPRAGGDDTLHDLERRLRSLPETPLYLTGGTDNGWRILLAHPRRPVRDLGPGVEVKTGRRQIVVPPSVHPDTGRRYEWDVHPDEVPLAPVPERWLAAMKAAPPRPQTQRSEEDWLRGLEPVRYVADLAGVAVPGPGKIRCPLPDHGDRTPSFHVYETPEDGWFCFGCRRGGDVFTLAALLCGRDPHLTGAAFCEVEDMLLSFYEQRLGVAA